MTTMYRELLRRTSSQKLGFCFNFLHSAIAPDSGKTESETCTKILRTKLVRASGCSLDCSPNVLKIVVIVALCIVNRDTQRNDNLNNLQ